MELRRIVGRAIRAAGRAAAGLDAALVPLRCVFCGVECEAGEQACCAGCRRDLPWIGAQCSGCAQPFAADEPSGLRCAACQARPGPFAAAYAPLHYRFPVDAAIRALKFHRRLEYGPALGALLVPALEHLSTDIDALLPVPLHWRRQAGRGYNQAAELCRVLHRQTGLPVLGHIRRARATHFQTALDARARRGNLRNAFAVRAAAAASHVLIVDDVMTTGATCRELARVAQAAGAGRVSVLVVARASVSRQPAAGVKA